MKKWITNSLLTSALLTYSLPSAAEGNPYDTAPSWNKSGTAIYFYSYRHGAAELYRMAPDGSNQTRLTNTDYNEWWPLAVPMDGKVIVTSDRDSGGNFKGANLFLLDEASGDMHNLTNVPEGHWAARADISMDTGKVIYTVAEVFAAPEQEMYMLDLETGDVSLYGDDPAHINTNPSISADGTLVAYASKRGGTVGVYLNDQSGKNERLFMEVQGENPLVRLSPDNRWMAITLSASAKIVGEEGPRTAERDIYLAKLDGSEIRRLTHAPGSDHGATWSPDGQTITFASYRHGPSDIYAVSANGENESNLTQTTPVPDHD